MNILSRTQYRVKNVFFAPVFAALLLFVGRIGKLAGMVMLAAYIAFVIGQFLYTGSAPAALS